MPAGKRRVSQHPHSLMLSRPQSTYSADDEHDHQRALWDRAWVIVPILSEEEQRREADLLDVQTNEDVLEGLGEEQPARVARARLLQLPQEEILVEHEEEQESDEGETVDDWRDDGIGDG